MRITNIDIPKTSESNDGLEHIKMDKLDKIVLIAGKNGSGKTRILNKIFHTLSFKPKKSRLNQCQIELIENRNQLNGNVNALNGAESQLTQMTEPMQKESVSLNIENYKRQITAYKNNIVSNEKEINWDLISTNEESDNYSFVKFVPKSLILQDCNTFAKSQLITSASTIDNVGIENLPQGAFAKIQFLQDRWYSGTHQNSQFEESEN